MVGCGAWVWGLRIAGLGGVVRAPRWLKAVASDRSPYWWLWLGLGLVSGHGLDSPCRRSWVGWLRGCGVGCRIRIVVVVALDWIDYGLGCGHLDMVLRLGLGFWLFLDLAVGADEAGNRVVSKIWSWSLMGLFCFSLKKAARPRTRYFSWSLS